METVISFTPAQFWTGFMAVCAAIVSISAAISVIGKAIIKVKKPNDDQNKRLDDHEEWLESHDEKLKIFEGYFDRDKQRLDTIEKGNRVTQKAILALLAHALDGNNIEPLRDAKEALQKYLINR